MSDLAPQTSPLALWREIQRLRSLIAALSSTSGASGGGPSATNGGATDPNGVVSATGYAVYIQKTSSTDYVLWVHLDSGTSTVWV